MGRYRNFWRGLMMAGLVVWPSLAFAQGRTVTGTVTRSGGNQQPIAEAVVSLVGTLTTARTGGDGTFRIEVPAGEVRLMVRAIGFTRREVTVGATQTTADIVLDEDVFKLDEVIVTGQATTTNRRNLSTAVSTVSGDDISKVASPTIENALQGKVAGINLQSNSGAPGGGIQLQIRGNTTILGASDPLYVIDGVIYSNARVAGGRGSAVAAAFSTAEDDPANRVADINPADIASIEILKGAAASSIYGSKASNGVVVIKTIRGQGGRTRTNVSQRFGFFDLQRDLESRTFGAGDVEAAVGIWGEGARPFFANGTPQKFDLYDQVFGRNELSYETVADVSGGDDNTRFFVSGTWKRDEGIADNTGFSRQGLRVNIDQTVSPKVEVQVSTVFNRSLHQRGFTNNGNNGATSGYALAYQPNFQSLLPVGGIFTGPALGTQGPGANPVQTNRLSRNEAETYRFTGGATLNWNVHTSDKSSFRFTAAGGVDVFNQADEVFTPNELFFERIQARPGTAVEQSATSRQTNYNVNGVHTIRPGEWQATTAFGVQLEERQLKSNRITTTDLVPGQSNVDQGTSFTPAENFTKERTLALYAQEELLFFGEKLLVTGGIRAERSSVNGDTEKFFVFPKGSASFRFTNVLPGLLGDGAEVKIRGAYGETGNQPLFNQKFTTLGTPQFGGSNGFTVAGAAGSPGVEPERLKEFEAGFDANIFGNRAQLEATFYTRNTTNLLLQRVPPPSSGFTSEVFNGGKIRNRGVEIGLGITPARGSFNWVTNATFTLNRNKVLDLPVDPFRPPLSGFGGLGVTFVEEGQPVTQIQGRKFLPDGSRSGQVKIGDAADDFRVGLANDISIGSFNFSMVWDWQQGGDVINLTQFLYDDAQNAADFGSAAHATRLLGFNAGVITPYIEDATFLKMRELSVGVDLPQNFVAAAFGNAVRTARVSLSGRNLILWTDYSGLDPEVANLGSAAIRNNLDVAPFPPSRSVFFNLALGF